MRAEFRIGDLFPAHDKVAQFLTGLCIVVNDVTLVLRHMDRIYDTPEGTSRVNTYYLYLTCSYYREAAKFLQASLSAPEVCAFVARLSTGARSNLRDVESSYTPWEGSFVQKTLKPIRDVVFHYEPWTPEKIAPFLARAADDVSAIEMGQGSYLEARYEFADAVFEEFVLGVWGATPAELTPVLERLVQLVTALTYFAHEAVTQQIQDIGPDKMTLE